MKPAVLVVDDDSATRAMLSKVLKVEGYSVQTAEHGGPALAIMRASADHLLVTLGLIMSEVDGMTVLEAVAADETLATRHAIVVLSAAVGMLRTGRGAELCQQLDLLLVPKPFTYEQLLETLEEAEQRWAKRNGHAQDGHAATVQILEAHIARRTKAVAATQLPQEASATVSTDGERPRGYDEVVRPGTPLHVHEDNGRVGQYRGSQNNNDNVDELLAQAHTLMCQCRYEEALPLALRAVERAPHSLKAWQELGMNYGYLGRVEELGHVFEQALRLAVTPEDEFLTWFSRGIAENNANAWEAALQSFQRMAELEPAWGAPLLFQGMVLGNMGAFIDKHYYEDMLVATDRALILGGLSLSDERKAYDLKVSALYGLGRREEVGYYQRKAKELRRAERAASSRPNTMH